MTIKWGAWRSPEFRRSRFGGSQHQTLLRLSSRVVKAQQFCRESFCSCIPNKGIFWTQSSDEAIFVCMIRADDAILGMMLIPKTHWIEGIVRPKVGGTRLDSGYTNFKASFLSETLARCSICAIYREFCKTFLQATSTKKSCSDAGLPSGTWKDIVSAERRCTITQR